MEMLKQLVKEVVIQRLKKDCQKLFVMTFIENMV